MELLDMTHGFDGHIAAAQAGRCASFNWHFFLIFGKMRCFGCISCLWAQIFPLIMA
jgi:hypothetical protein